MEMDTRRIDFIESLQTNMAFDILMCIDDPADLVRSSTVSRFWRSFIIANGLCKELCLKKFPQLSRIANITKPNCSLSDVGSSSVSAEWTIHERDHCVYASLLKALDKSISTTEFIENAISASSTDNYPIESIINTLNPRDRYFNRASYWSSKGHHDPAAPETLIYKLRANLGVVTEIKIQPFEAYFQEGSPIYSAKSVRFRMGHPKSQSETEQDLLDLPMQKPADEKFVWTYTSQEFPMAQENRLQEFKLPEPVLCVGGYIQVELLGRVQTQEMDGLFYICISHVQIMGRPLSPAFDIEMVEPSGKFILKYYPEGLQQTLKNLPNDDDSENIGVLSPDEVMFGRVGLLEYLMGGNQQPAGQALDWDDDDENELDEMLIM